MLLSLFFLFSTPSFADEPAIQLPCAKQEKFYKKKLGVREIYCFDEAGNKSGPFLIFKTSNNNLVGRGVYKDGRITLRIEDTYRDGVVVRRKIYRDGERIGSEPVKLAEATMEWNAGKVTSIRATAEFKKCDDEFLKLSEGVRPVYSKAETFPGAAEATWRAKSLVADEGETAAPDPEAPTGEKSKPKLEKPKNNAGKKGKAVR